MRHGHDAASASTDAIPDVVRVLARRLDPILGERLVGLYLGGSASMGDIAPSSDFDVLVVTEGTLTLDDLGAIDALHARLAREHPDGHRLEGDYAPRHLLAPTGTTAPVPGIHAGRFEPHSAEIMLSADNIANMRLDGIAVRGPPASAVLPAATPDDVRAAVLAMLIDGPGHCTTEDEAASELLNLLRSLCALESGQPTTKSQGAAWAFAHLDQGWHEVIDRAVAIRQGRIVASDDRTLRTALPVLERTLRSIWSSDRG